MNRRSFLSSACAAVSATVAGLFVTRSNASACSTASSLSSTAAPSSLKTPVLTDKMSAEDALEYLRYWFARGATISAINPDGPILKWLPDGTMHGGLYIVNGGRFKMGTETSPQS